MVSAYGWIEHRVVRSQTAESILAMANGTQAITNTTNTTPSTLTAFCSFFTRFDSRVAWNAFTARFISLRLLTSSANRFAPMLPGAEPVPIVVPLMLSVPVLALPKPSASPPDIAVGDGVDGAVWFDRAEKKADGVDELVGFDGDTLGER